MSEHRRAALGWVLILLVVAVAVAWIFVRHTSESIPTPAEAPAADATERDADDLPTLPKPTKPPAPLPARDAPLSTISVQLEALARNGDSRAACRLAVELLRCAEIELWREELAREGSLDTSELSSEADGDFDRADKWASEEIWRIRQLEQCRLLPRALHDQAWDHLRDAALAGEPEAIIRYASSPQLGMGMGNGFLHHPGFDDWRREAPVMLQRLFRAGDRDAAMLLMLTSLGDMDPLSGLIGGDEQDFLAYRLLHWRMRSDAPPAPSMNRYSASQIEQATRRAEAWHRDYFAGRLFPKRVGSGKLTPLMMPNRDQPPPCE